MSKVPRVNSQIFGYEAAETCNVIASLTDPLCYSLDNYSRVLISGGNVYLQKFETVEQQPDYATFLEEFKLSENEFWELNDVIYNLEKDKHVQFESGMFVVFKDRRVLNGIPNHDCSINFGRPNVNTKKGEFRLFDCEVNKFLPLMKSILSGLKGQTGIDSSYGNTLVKVRAMSRNKLSWDVHYFFGHKVVTLYESNKVKGTKIRGKKLLCILQDEFSKWKHITKK